MQHVLNTRADQQQHVTRTETVRHSTCKSMSITGCSWVRNRQSTPVAVSFAAWLINVIARGAHNNHHSLTVMVAVDRHDYNNSSTTSPTTHTHTHTV